MIAYSCLVFCMIFYFVVIESTSIIPTKNFAESSIPEKLQEKVGNPSTQHIQQFCAKKANNSFDLLGESSATALEKQIFQGKIMKKCLRQQMDSLARKFTENDSRLALIALSKIYRKIHTLVQLLKESSFKIIMQDAQETKLEETARLKPLSEKEASFLSFQNQLKSLGKIILFLFITIHRHS